jgi:hypothetical protein
MAASAQSPDEHRVRFDLLTENPVYKPFRYPWAYEAWLTQIFRVFTQAATGFSPPAYYRVGSPSQWIAMFSL